MIHEPSSKKLIVITGPTATGKTAVAIQLANHFKTVIISADSRQFYLEMSIGTAKPTTDELAAAKHYFINSHTINENFTVGDYEKECLALLDILFQVYDKVLLVGGSGLFIKAICNGFDEFPVIAPGIRDTLNKDLNDTGLAALQERLQIADPEYYAQADINNPQRVIRALEVFESSGKPFSSFRTLTINKRPFNIIKISLDLPREALYKRINKRVDDMIAQGLLEEARTLLPNRHLNALQTVGYSELFTYFEGKTDLKPAIELIKQNTRRFAKRQLTWFRKDNDIVWMPADSKTLIADILEVIN